LSITFNLVKHQQARLEPNIRVESHKRGSTPGMGEMENIGNIEIEKFILVFEIAKSILINILLKFYC
jgi:hypothetical protein